MYAVILIENKNDKRKEREISYLDKLILIKILKCDFVEISVKIIENIEKTFCNVVRLLKDIDPLK
jgi:hypothetical protein